MKRKKILALTLAAAMSLALFSGCSRPSASSGGNDNPSANNTGSTSSEEPIVIKIGHTDSDTRSTHKWSVWLGEWLEEQAPGSASHASCTAPCGGRRRRKDSGAVLVSIR